MVKNQNNSVKWLVWMLSPEDSSKKISEKHYWVECERNRCLHETTKYLGWMKTVFWIIAAQASAFLISRL